LGAHPAFLAEKQQLESSLQHGLDRSIGRALASAAGLIITAQKPVAAK
jgi:hypothetical protein